MSEITPKKKSNPFLLIVKFPILLLKYEVLGIYYVIYGLLFPFRMFYNIISSALYKAYKNKGNKKQVIDLNEIAPEEAESIIRSEDDLVVNEAEAPARKVVAEKKSKFSLKAQAKQQQEKDALIKSLQSDAGRNIKPLTYRYTAINSDGKKEINTLIAFSKMEVFSFLENEGYNVLKIENSKLIEILYGPSFINSGKFKNKDLIFWLTQLSTYIKSGIPLTDSMRILGKQMNKDRSKKRVFDSVIYYLTLGEAFSSALEKQNNVFPPLLINMIKAAEATGDLEETLDDMANYYNDIETTRKQMVSAMSYPAIIMVFSIAVVVFILLYVIPQFQVVYAQSGATLNNFTLLIINTSDFLSKNIIYLGIVIVVFIIVLIILYKKIKAFKYVVQKLLMHIPLIKNIIIYKEMNIFAKTFSSLLKNNVFITESIGILTNITNNEIYKEIMVKTIENIAKGDKISKSFKDNWAVPDVAYYMIVTGESTGELAEMMARVADYYQTSHKAIINSMKSFIEPVMIIFLAVVVGSIVMAVVLPMFGLYEQIQ